ncbi:MAG: bifunctional D-glycero-beta-D-manno-heptose-7-phosphate kinase/D-glycero-beta-D-manno-heptose 1-phosphate adenylyltransferase HldE, partial [Nevskiales bacterium]
MLDRYWHGPTGRISPEAPVPVVRIQQTEERAGGAANVALNIAALGAGATILGVVGQDEAAGHLAAQMQGAGVSCDFERSATHPTITKLRVLSRNQQLIRLDFEESLSVSGAFDQAGFMARFKAALEKSQVVVLSDYGKGTLVAPDELIRQARAAGRPVLIDPKGRDYARYRGASLLTPNLSELEAVAGPCPDETTLVARAEKLRAELELDALLITRSEQGMTLLRAGQPALHLPAAAREVYDVTGAGDTVIALLAAGLAAGQDLPQAARLANIGAGVVVGKLGTATVSVAELRRAIRDLHGDDGGVLDEAGLLERVAETRAHGETVVMTNGCFDFIHPGHVRYLEAARKLGDCLIVAVNDDESVRHLKGASRPVNPLAHRMQVLAALKSVDWVVPFSEDTPARLIGRVLPDILVKGGDYRAEDVAGYEAVTKNGGQVRILDFHAGYSTTAILEKAERLDEAGQVAAPQGKKSQGKKS